MGDNLSNRIIAGGTIILGIVGIVSLWLTHESLRETRDQFHAAQRPYVWLTEGGGGTPQFVQTAGRSDGQIIWNWHVTNYGKAPASSISYWHYMKVGSEPFRLSWGGPNKGILGPIPTGGQYVATIVSKPGITTQEFKDLMNTDEALQAKIIISYTDGLTWYTTGVCLAYLRVGATLNCREGNYIN
jgi:hypothetical protein